MAQNDLEFNPRWNRGGTSYRFAYRYEIFHPFRSEQNGIPNYVIKSTGTEVSHLSLCVDELAIEVSQQEIVMLTQPKELKKSGEEILEIQEVDRTWGTASDWFIDLRDDRRLRLPMHLLPSLLVQSNNNDEDPTTGKLIQWIQSQNPGKLESDADLEWGGAG